MNRIAFTGGGTAGHIVPNLALLPYLENTFDDFCYIGSCEMEERLCKNAGVPFYRVSTAKLARKFTVKNFAIPYKVIKGYGEAKKLLSDLKPDVVFSKGGFVSVPVVYAAAALGIPVVSHESDLTAGLANKITSNKADKVLTAFPETAKHVKKGEYVGCPMRKELFSAAKAEAIKHYGFGGVKPVLLVLGGSQGSKKLNDCIESALEDLLPRFDILQICGKGNADNKMTNGRLKLEYENDMARAYAAADIALSRAGATTVFELLALKIPAVVVPLAKGASRGDQVENAEYFLSKGLISVLYEHNLTPASLVAAVSMAYADRFNFKRRLENENFGGAAARIASILSAYAKR